ncbi:MAG TPA: adenylyltransferase/cytidyltransferase family protein [Opitutus sp.]|nr:adenylyltransferase/cytidyltransferase family protein [Opitutus sp.]
MPASDSLLRPNPKLRTLATAVAERRALAAAGRKVVLTNGCFDLLHPGHIHFLQHARAAGDALFVALNGDASVRALKGPSRPMLPAADRAFALAALACTDLILTFDTPRLDAEIRALRPDLYVKAGDYSLASLDPAERAALDEVGAEIRFLPFLPGFSTTELLKRIAAAQSSPRPPA